MNAEKIREQSQPEKKIRESMKQSFLGADRFIYSRVHRVYPDEN
jgi:hypothetical protein